MRKLLSALLIVAIVAPLAGCGSAGSSNKVRIGLITPLTGDVKTYGESVKQGAELAIDQWNKNGGVLGKQIELSLADDKNDPAEASAAATKLITQDKIKLLLGGVTSKCAIPVSEIAEKNQVLDISPTATSPKLTVDPWPGGTRKEYVFRACFIDDFQASAMSQFALSNNMKKAAVVYDNGNDYCVGLAQSFRKYYTQGGGTINVYEAYSQSDTDFSAILTKVIADNPDMLYIPDYYGTVNLIAKQARAMGFKGTFAGADGWDSPDLDVQTVEGSYFTNHYSPDDPRPEVQNFVKAYKDKYGTVPDALGMLAYEGTNLLLNAVKTAGSDDPTKVKDALQATKGFTTVSGDITFNADGNPIKGIAILKISGGKQELVTSVKPTSE